VKCWGSNHNGELGNGTTTDAAGAGPVDVTGLTSGVSAISAGGSHTCAITSGGGVKCWGYNLYGQLGDGTNTDSSVPVDVSGLTSGVSAIAVGWSSTCALTDIGGVKCWGNNHFGWLGDGTTTDRSVPVDVSGLTSGATAIAVGTLHSCAVMRGGGVKCWGYGYSDDPTVSSSSVPIDVRGLGSGATAISAGLDRTCVLTDVGEVMCWSPRLAPASGQGFPGPLVPVDVPGLAGGVVAIATGEYHTCALTSSGGVACWGSNAYGELGNFSMPATEAPVEVAGMTSGVSAIAMGGMHSCALTSGGGVWCWGSNVQGQLGTLQRCSSTSIPVDVPLLGAVATPSPSLGPAKTPKGVLDHATSPAEVVLRVDLGPDVGLGDLVGELFRAGPEFTLYGDGTAIFRDERANQLPAEGPIVRAAPFITANLDESQVQELLRFALFEGGLREACERYETQASDPVGSAILTVRAGGYEKRVVDWGTGPYSELSDYLRTFMQGGSIPTQVWAGDRYWGNLIEAGPYIESGSLPDPTTAGAVPWPWPNIAPEEFRTPTVPNFGDPRRVMSSEEAAVLGLSNDGGVVQRTYLIGPDGETIYYFSLWPVLPDEAP
jgi:hypothetical protein